MKIPNPIDPDHLTTRERLGEVCALLARGLVRLRQRAAEGDARRGDICLHLPGDRSRHATPTHEETA